MVPDFEGVKKLVPIPPTQETVNTLFPDAIIQSQKDDMLRWYEGQEASCRQVVKPRTARRPP